MSRITLRIFIAFAMIAVPLGACSDDKPNTGGSGVDAPPPPPPPPPPVDAASTTCNVSDPTSCTGETICIGTGCAEAFGRIYTFGGINVTVATHKPDGSDWDLGGGAPDPKVTLKLNGTQILQTSVKNNTFTATYTESVDKEVIAGSTLDIDVSDDDLTTDDRILQCSISPITPDDLRNRQVHCGTTSTILLSIEAKL